MYPISDEWFHRVKAATRDLIKVCGGVVRAGEIACASKSEVSRWQSVGDEGIIPITAMLALERDCGEPFVTRVLADLNGRRISGPDEAPETSSSVMSDHAEVVRAAAEMMMTGAKALADGKVTPAEAEMFDRAVSELECAVAPLRRTLAALKSSPNLAVVK